MDKDLQKLKDLFKQIDAGYVFFPVECYKYFELIERDHSIYNIAYWYVNKIDTLEGDETVARVLGMAWRACSESIKKIEQELSRRKD